MYLSTSTEDFPGMYLSTIQVLYKLYLSTDVLKYKVLLPGSDANHYTTAPLHVYFVLVFIDYVLYWCGVRSHAGYIGYWALM